MAGISDKDDGSLSRRQMLRGATVTSAVVVLSTLCAQQAQAGAMTKQAAGYQATPKGEERCDNCNLFQAPSSCKFVAGDVSPQGWCRLWQKKS